MDIRDFLLARIAEEETYAYHALGLLGMENPWWTGVALKSCFPDLSRADALHIEQHSPRRVMADCAARRAIVEAFDPDMPDLDPYVGRDVVAILAAVYADHPDYQQEWAQKGMK